jgi:2-haloacid dehalogenase/putative hydrolase of the HAD superfamily
VLWDIGNVIVRWDPRTLYSKIFPDPAERDRFLAEVCTPAWHHQADLGRPMAENVARLSVQHPEHAAAIAAWKDRWGEMFCGTIDETTTAIEALHARGAPMFGLSNAPAGVMADVRAMHPAFGLLRDIVVSGEEKMAKPDPAIFALACRRAGLAPDELLFVDDVAVNIEAARALGFHVHHFADPAALAPALERSGLL